MPQLIDLVADVIHAGLNLSHLIDLMPERPLIVNRPCVDVTACKIAQIHQRSEEDHQPLSLNLTDS